MKRVTDLKERINKIIEQRRQKLEREIEVCETKLRDTEQYYGFGGAYSRQLLALERREKQLKQLEDFKKQLEHTVKVQSATMYIFGCRNCGSIIMTSRYPADQWHECPSCRQMIYTKNMKSTDFEIIDKGEPWIQMLRKEAGRED